VNRQIEGFELAPHAEALVSLHGVNKTELINKARGLMLDEKPLIKLLHIGRNERLKQIKLGEKV